MADQDQTISGQVQDSQVQLAQAGENAISFQNSHHNQVTILKIFQLFGSGAAPSTIAAMDWDYAQEILNDQLNEIRTRLKYTVEDSQHLMSVDFKWVKWASPLQAERRLQVNGTDQGTLDTQRLLIETFGNVGGKLLILGAPGAGKTTALLELAEQLVCGAIAQPQTVIPVIFELSTWSKDEQSIEDWLIERLHYQYRGDRAVYKNWIERKKLLPLLIFLYGIVLESTMFIGCLFIPSPNAEFCLSITSIESDYFWVIIIISAIFISYCLVFGLILSLSLSLMLGLIVQPMYLISLGLQQELETYSFPNQGIRNSLRNMVWTTIFCSSIVCLGFLGMFLLDSTNGENTQSFIELVRVNSSELLIVSISCGVFFGMVKGGGFPFIQHYCLRFVLAQRKIAPWDLPQFLNYSVERRLLQRVGGRYRFLHRELLDFFASNRSG